MRLRYCPKCGAKMDFSNCIDDELDFNKDGSGWLIREETWECGKGYTCGYWEAVRVQYNLTVASETLLPDEEDI